MGTLPAGSSNGSWRGDAMDPVGVTSVSSLDGGKMGLPRLLAEVVAPGSLIQGTMLSVVGAGGNRALQIGALLLVAHRFGPGGLVTVSAVILWSSILGLAIAPGFSLPLTGAVAGARARAERGIWPILFLVTAAILTVIVVAAVVWLSAGITAPGLNPACFAILLAVMASGFCIQAVTLAGLIAERAYWQAMLSSLLLGAGQMVAVVLAVDPATAAVCVAGGTLLVGAISAALLFWQTVARDRDAKARFTQWRVMLGRIPPSLIGSSVVEPTNLIVLTYIFTAARTPINTSVITVAQQWLSLLLFVPAIVNQVILPRLMHRVETGDLIGFRRQAWRIVGLNFALTLVPALALMIARSSLLSAYHLTGAEYPFVVLLCAGWFSALAFPFGTVLTGLGHFKFSAFGNIFWCVVFLTVSLLLVQRSTDGFAEARLSAYSAFLLFVSLATFARLRRLTSIVGGGGTS
ncbi:O-antigen/teichoic acid export membrane protein [Sphingomonas xinjiangensis]|uniref:O-antigen/teichoic acid export membrane protein n=2 Tax=Sphingomonas xinjiangensis TaxID=643568 RepID=A0A840YSZ4_9SPHN|nr:O-antigen/teichoic acid export membrane protein [Sphingomonas xinjiangensis]